MPIAFLLIAMVSIQSGASLAKSLFPILGVKGTIAMRLGLAALMMMVLLRGWRAKLTATNWQTLGIYGAMLAAMNIMFYLAINRIPLGLAAAIQFLGPLTVTILHSQRRRDLVWAGLAAAGLFLIMPIKGALSGLDPVGILWALGAAVGWGGYIVSGKKAGAQHGGRTAALGMFIAALIGVPLGVADLTVAAISDSVILLCILVAVLTGVIPFTLEMSALRQLPAKTFGTLTSLEPVVAGLIGWLVLGEILTTRQVLAIAMIVIACAGATLSSRERATPIPVRIE